MPYRPAAVALLLLLAAAAPALADPAAWQTSFGAAAVASHHPGKLDAVVVVGAGAAGADRDEAAGALVTAYKDGGRARLVLDAQPLGDVSGLSDPDILARAGALAVSHVAIVRVLDSTAGEPTAMVAVYTRKGAPVTSFIATAGTPLPAKETVEPRGASAGISQTTVDNVTSAKETTRTEQANAKTEFDQGFIWFDDFIVVNGYGGTVGHGAIAYQGVAKRVLDGEEFYRAVGRDDLAEGYQTRRNTKIGVAIAGGAIAIGGFVYAFNHDDCGDFDSPTWSECEDGNLNTTLLGIGVSTAGMAVAGIAFLIPSHPASLSERRQLAIDHNARLRGELHLDEDYMPRRFKAEADATFSDVRIAPYAAPGGGGLVVGGRF